MWKEAAGIGALGLLLPVFKNRLPASNIGLATLGIFGATLFTYNSIRRNGVVPRLYSSAMSKRHLPPDVRLNINPDRVLMWKSNLWEAKKNEGFKRYADPTISFIDNLNGQYKRGEQTWNTGIDLRTYVEPAAAKLVQNLLEEYVPEESQILEIGSNTLSFSEIIEESTYGRCVISMSYLAKLISKNTVISCIIPTTTVEL